MKAQDVPWLEATGGYERVGKPAEKDRDCDDVAHPNRKACGYEAKTDQRDAQVLSRYGQVFPEH